jgi:predicted lysophospholipase L1 biosynthesis ABC-type transport system permease subunit
MAARVWPAGDALGQRFRLAADTTGVWFTVVGISRDIANWDLSDRPMPSAYLPFPHATDSEPRLIVRASGDPAAVAATVRDAVQAADPLLTLKDVRPMAQVHREAFWRNELFGSVLASFGGVALLLAAVGVYGVLSYLVSQRTREVGVRLALGARRADVVRLVVRQGMTLVLGGVGLGLVGAFAVTRLLRRQLHAVSPTDPVGFASVALLLIAAGFLASYIPASRAASVDPIESLRR